MDDSVAALSRAIAICDGSQAELARRLREIKKNPRIRQAHVWNWLNRDKKVPADMVLAVEAATIDDATKQARVQRHELRSDLYPSPEPTQLELSA